MPKKMNEKRLVFIDKLGNYWHCEMRHGNSGEALLRTLQHPRSDLSEAEFRSFLAEAILTQGFRMAEYERLVGADFSNEDGITKDLEELWRAVFGDR